MKIRNRTLYHKIQDFIKASLTILNGKYPSPENYAQFVTHGAKYSIEDSGFIRYNDYRVDFFILVFSNSKDVEKLPEFIDCANYFLQNPITREAHGWRSRDG